MYDKYKYNRNNFNKFGVRSIYCANCGEKDHILKQCNGPITSFGIIAFKNCIEENDVNDTNDELKEILKEINVKPKNNYPKIKFLMIQRKDTMGYVDFVRGKYDAKCGHEKEAEISVCLDEMTKEEKDNLLNKNFDNIWLNLWVDCDSKCFKNEYETAKKKFLDLPIKNLVDKSNTTYTFSEFGFPKGRRNMKEKNIECAKREFLEETGYDKNCYDFIENYPLIVEEFLGTNNVKYRHIYYLVKIKDDVHPPKIDLNNKIQTGEVKNIGWFTIDECIQLIRPYDIAKKQVIQNVHNNIVNKTDMYICPSYEKDINCYIKL